MGTFNSLKEENKYTVAVKRGSTYLRENSQKVYLIKRKQCVSFDISQSFVQA